MKVRKENENVGECVNSAEITRDHERTDLWRDSRGLGLDHNYRVLFTA